MNEALSEEQRKRRKLEIRLNFLSALAAACRQEAVLVWFGYLL